MLNSYLLPGLLCAASLHFFSKTLLAPCFPFFLPCLFPSLSILLHPLSHQQFFRFFNPSASLCPPAFLFMSLISLPHSLACCAQPSGLWGVCFPLACYAESCHMHVWTCRGGALMWCWHMHASLLCSGQGQRGGHGAERRGEVNWGQRNTGRCKNENKLLQSCGIRKSSF